MDLFKHSRQEQIRREAPLAARLRPRTLDEFVGQEHIVGEGRLLHRAIEADRLLSSLIFWGPPGTGKTTLAMVIANTTASHFETISAVLAGVADLRRIIKEAEDYLTQTVPSRSRSAGRRFSLSRWRTLPPCPPALV
jgi:putative ATPase